MAEFGFPKSIDSSSRHSREFAFYATGKTSGRKWWRERVEWLDGEHAERFWNTFLAVINASLPTRESCEWEALIREFLECKKSGYDVLASWEMDCLVELRFGG